MKNSLDTSTKKRPVIGVLAEPLRGEVISDYLHYEQYIPRAYVDFLEQGGMKVVPVDYKLALQEGALEN